MLPLRLAALIFLATLTACSATQTVGRPEGPAPVTGKWALAIHGGAGVISRKDMSPQAHAQHAASLRKALTVGKEILAKGGSALDACEQVVRTLEDDPHFNAGKGAVFTADARHELDAAIMDGQTLQAGAVTGVKTVKNPISLARLVMQRTRHILLSGDGAETFATTVGVERVPNTYFDTDYRRKVLDEVLEERRRESQKPAARSDGPATGPIAFANRARHTHTNAFGTVGCVALDSAGNLAVATSTGGLTGKQWNRIGDSPQIGAGTYANNRSAAISGTGTGEQFIRHTVARDVAALIEYKGFSAQQAAEEVVFRRLNPDDGGVIVVSRTGEIALVFSSEGMYRGAANSSGRFEVAIWKNNE